MILYFLLPMILILGFITSYEDYRYGKIKNIWLVLSLVYLFILLMILFGLKVISYSYLIPFIVNFLSCMLVSVLLWKFRLLSAADAKLIITFNALLPLTIYRGTFHERYFPFFSLLINLFFIGFLFIIFYILGHSKLSNFISSLKSSFITFKPLSLLNIFLAALAFPWLFSLLQISSILPLIIFLTYLLFTALSFLLRKYLVYSIAILAVLRLFFGNNILSIDFLISYTYIIISMIIFTYIQTLLILQSKTIFYEERDIKDIERGDIVKYISKTKGWQSIDSELSLSPEGISEKELIDLSRNGYEKAILSKTIAFAPLIFISVLLTILLSHFSL